MWEEYRKVYNMLEDDISKDIYMSRLSYLITGDIKYIDYIVRTYIPDYHEWKTRAVLEFNSRYANTNVVLWGLGKIAVYYSDILDKLSNVKCICDNDPDKWGGDFLGVPVISPAQFFTEYQGEIVLVTTYLFQDEIETLLVDHGIEEEKVVRLSSIISAYAHEGQYFNEDFLHFGNEIFLDVGVLDLNTTIKFRDICGDGLKKVYALEPDNRSYERCVKNKEKYGLTDIVELFHAGAWSQAGELSFNSVGTGGSKISDQGVNVIKTVAIDDVVKEDVTYIKMDIEGAELEALRGAAKTIQRCKPKLAVCIYHKHEDMTVIPLYIQSLNPDYKFYVRHYSAGGEETVLYAI